ncbi:MAG: nuclear transport factor 2 family protein [Chloroflexaceae bacterium]|nr:nuclear transport factor 2 family protein [Chloroflexaceae bacterium]
MSRLSQIALLWVSLGISTAIGPLVQAQTPAPAPAELTNAIAQIQAAANQRNLSVVMGFYSPDFSSNDGINNVQLSEALAQLWQRYPQLFYETELQSWERAGDELVAETVTTIRGTQTEAGRTTEIVSTIRSRQYFRNGQVLRQEILSERTNVTAGENPPQVRVNLPETATPGQQFGFDVIVEEPLRNDVLLGAAVEETVKSDLYLQPSALELEPLSAGGIFKLVKAPAQIDSRWLSAIIVRDDGITQVTQRLRVVDAPKSAQ